MLAHEVHILAAGHGRVGDVAVSEELVGAEMACAVALFRGALLVEDGEAKFRRRRVLRLVAVLRVRRYRAVPERGGLHARVVLGVRIDTGDC